jgi:hypothetical protein
MNKSAIEKFAVRARRRLREQVEQKAFEIGITANEIKKPDIESSDGFVFNGRNPYNSDEKRQRERLVREIKEHGFDQVMDEAAYTWFNRFVALRFMEVNGYLETGVRVFSFLDPAQKDPDILTQAFQVDLPLDRAKLFEYHDKNNNEGLFKHLLLTQCNVLYEAMPFLFEKIADYTELLFPNNLLNADSVIREMVGEIPEEDWREVEIIGWLYQYYISEKKDEVFAGLKKNQKITKENIPAATQLFTPHWIVRYMVENSVGRLWLESHPNEELKAKWKYYLEPVEQEPEVQAELDKLVNKNLKPEDIKMLDPACGSGHILVYAFDLFYDIYRVVGYLEAEIPRLILENNLYGLDIDDRAAQLACLAVAMKAREKSRTILKEKIGLNICTIQETNDLPERAKEILLQGTTNKVYAKQQIQNLWDTFHDAKEYGSIIKVKGFDTKFWKEHLAGLVGLGEGLFDGSVLEELWEKLPPFVKQSKIMSQRYDVVVTNPPYMGDQGMNGKLVQYIKDNYPDSKSDLSIVFMEICLWFCNGWGFMGMINIPSWMFISSYEKMRKKIINNNTIISMLHLGRGIFGSDFGTTTFVINKKYFMSYIGRFKKLFFVQGAVDSIEQKELWFLEGVGEFTFKQSEFNVIPSTPIAFWASKNIREIFNTAIPLEKIAEPRQGLATGNNDCFMKLWSEVSFNKIGFGFNEVDKFHEQKHFYCPHNKGGSFRKWFGNHEYVLKFEKRSYDLLINLGNKLPSRQYYFKACLTWSKVTIGSFSVRYFPEGFTFDSAGCSIFADKGTLNYVLGFLNSNTSKYIIGFLSPTINYEVGHIRVLPIIQRADEKINELVMENIDISRCDWDYFENSWNFQRHPLLIHQNGVCALAKAFTNWESFSNKQFCKLKSNEEELNRIFINIYGLQDELTPDVAEKDITIRRTDLKRDIRSFISYAVSCMMGRYSLDEPGLVYAGGKFELNKYQTFLTDRDGILPVLEEEYFVDDIVARLVEFIKVTFGEKTFAENLEFISKALGQTENESALERIRKYFLNDFFKDHLQVYKNRPIYWLFTSGKEKAFNALIYMHRYDKSTIGRIRTDYLHELQGKIELERRRLAQVLNGDTAEADKRTAGKRLTAMAKQQEELRRYDELLRHYADQQIEIDLDDGVRVNYGKFRELLAVVKGFEKEEE